ncbi:hypothetical protein BMS3Abin06_01891 [bacterium BMS3Abin06]|nr:hypothetical protein BMS3Abin06_01891 [bacterium BMS3Abin06]
MKSKETKKMNNKEKKNSKEIEIVKVSKIAEKVLFGEKGYPRRN